MTDLIMVRRMVEPPRWMRDRMRELNIRNVDIQRETGLPSSRVSEILEGRRKIQPVEIIPIARILQLPPLEVLRRMHAVTKTEAQVGAAEPSIEEQEELFSLILKLDDSTVRAAISFLKTLTAGPASEPPKSG